MKTSILLVALILIAFFAGQWLLIKPEQADPLGKTIQRSEEIDRLYSPGKYYASRNVRGAGVYPYEDKIVFKP